MLSRVSRQLRGKCRTLMPQMRTFLTPKRTLRPLTQFRGVLPFSGEPQKFYKSNQSTPIDENLGLIKEY